KSYVYALGYKALGSEVEIFYIENNESSDDLVIRCIKSMVVKKYDGFTFYVHNLSGYDVVFIISAILKYNSKNNNYFKLDPTFRDNRILKLKISIKTKSETIKI